MLVSPTEPALIKGLGAVSSVCEEHGVDVLWATAEGLVGVQRKEIRDLFASVRDGRLAREVAQMAGLSRAALVVEGRPRWTSDGLWCGREPWSVEAYRSLLHSVADRGIYVARTDSIAETVEWVRSWHAWTLKHRHVALRRRPGPGWTAGSREWQRWLLQSFDGVGPETADAIIEHFGGLPLRWTVSEEELRQVKGVGPRRARRLMEALGGGS